MNLHASMMLRAVYGASRTCMFENYTVSNIRVSGPVWSQLFSRIRDPVMAQTTECVRRNYNWLHDRY